MTATSIKYLAREYKIMWPLLTLFSIITFDCLNNFNTFYNIFLDHKKTRNLNNKNTTKWKVINLYSFWELRG